MQPAVEMINMYKTFHNSIKALQGAGISVSRGEIHGLVGENAAGKTTLMNVLYGLVRPDRGEIYIDGEKKDISHPKDAIKYGIGMVHQHFILVPEFTVLDNIILGNENRFLGYGWKINYAQAAETVQDFLHELGITVDLHKEAGRLSIGLQQKVEIVKIFFRGADIIILDEPTTVLAPNEIDGFLEFLVNLKAKGKTVIFISHRLKEVFSIADTITVLQKGRAVKTVKTPDTSMEEVSVLMIGRKIENLERHRKTVAAEKILELNKVSLRDKKRCRLQDISLGIRKGEILGIAGIEGNGQTDLAEVIMGLKPVTGGEILYCRQKITNSSIAERRRQKMRYIPDDKIKSGLALGASITENTIMSYHRTPSLSRRIFLLDWQAAARFTENIIKEYRVQGMSSPQEKVAALSGGNMQKLLIGREFARAPRFIVAAQPTVGLDLGAKFAIHKKLLELSRQGTAILLISEDLDELMTLADRIIVLYRGKTVKEFVAEDGYDEIELGYFMTGVKGTDE